MVFLGHEIPSSRLPTPPPWDAGHSRILGAHPLDEIMSVVLRWRPGLLRSGNCHLWAICTVLFTMPGLPSLCVTTRRPYCAKEGKRVELMVMVRQCRCAQFNFKLACRWG